MRDDDLFNDGFGFEFRDEFEAELNPDQVFPSLLTGEAPLPSSSAALLWPTESVPSVTSDQQSQLAKDIEALDIRDRHHSHFDVWETDARRLQELQKVGFGGLRARLKKEMRDAPEDQKHMYQMLAQASHNINSREKSAKKRKAAITKQVDEGLIPDSEIEKHKKSFKAMSFSEREQELAKHSEALQIPNGEHTKGEWEAWARTLQVMQNVGFGGLSIRLARSNSGLSENEQHKYDKLSKACNNIASRDLSARKRQMMNDEKKEGQPPAKRKKTEKISDYSR